MTLPDFIPSQLPLYCNTKRIFHTQHPDGPVVFVSREISYTFPLSYAYLAGYLQEHGLPVKIFFKDKPFKELAQDIMDAHPLIVGFGNLFSETEEVREIIYYLNALGRDFPICIGGQMVTPTPDFACRVTGAEYGVIGEGEIILHQLCSTIQKGESAREVPGLFVQDGLAGHFTGEGSYIRDVDHLPAIPYELFPEEKWLNIGEWYAAYLPEQAHWRFGDRVVNIHGGRGCPFHCNFCYHHNRPRYRSISVMIDEARQLIERFQANMLYFSDDLVISSPKRAKELIAGIRTLSHPVEFSLSTRFDLLEKLDDETLLAMKAAGCRIMGLGIESGSDRILKIIGKNTNAVSILRQLKRLQQVGILPTVSIMIGQDTETKEDVEQSIALMQCAVRDNPHINFAFTLVTPFPGSKLFQKIMDNKLCQGIEDFYTRYYFDQSKARGDWNLIVNLSAMQDQDVLMYLDAIEYFYQQEKARAFAGTAKALERIYTLQRQTAATFRQLPHPCERDKVQYQQAQLKLEKAKFDIWGLPYTAAQ